MRVGIGIVIRRGVVFVSSGITAVIRTGVGIVIAVFRIGIVADVRIGVVGRLAVGVVFSGTVFVRGGFAAHFVDTEKTLFTFAVFFARIAGLTLFRFRFVVGIFVVNAWFFVTACRDCKNEHQCEENFQEFHQNPHIKNN